VLLGAVKEFVWWKISQDENFVKYWPKIQGERLTSSTIGLEWYYGVGVADNLAGSGDNKSLADRVGVGVAV
jgi:hypothetical protein